MASPSTSTNHGGGAKEGGSRDEGRRGVKARRRRTGDTVSEPNGRGVAWTKERGTSDEGGRRLEGALEASGRRSTSDEGRRRSEGGWGGGWGPEGERETQ